MSADSFSVLIQTEQQAAQIIRAAKDRRKDILREHEATLSQEIDAFKQEEQKRIELQMQEQDQDLGSKGDDEEQEILRKINEIQTSASANIGAMAELLVDTVASV